jgi:hypothetical protein
MQSDEIEFFVYVSIFDLSNMSDKIPCHTYMHTQMKSSNFNAKTRNENLQNEDVLHL